MGLELNTWTFGFFLPRSHVVVVVTLTHEFTTLNQTMEQHFPIPFSFHSFPSTRFSSQTNLTLKWYLMCIVDGGNAVIVFKVWLSHGVTTRKNIFILVELLIWISNYLKKFNMISQLSNVSILFVKFHYQINVIFKFLLYWTCNGVNS